MTSVSTEKEFNSNLIFVNGHLRHIINYIHGLGIILFIKEY